MVRFPDIFEGIGKFPGLPYEIQLDPNVPPKQTPCRPVPIHLKQAFKTDIDKMLKAGVLKPVPRQVFSNLCRRQHHGLIPLCSSKVPTNKVNPSSGYVYTQQT